MVCAKENLCFDNEQVIHMSLENYEKNAQGFDLDLLRISFNHMFTNLGEVGAELKVSILDLLTLLYRVL